MNSKIDVAKHLSDAFPIQSSLEQGNVHINLLSMLMMLIYWAKT